MHSLHWCPELTPHVLHRGFRGFILMVGEYDSFGVQLDCLHHPAGTRSLESVGWPWTAVHEIGGHGASGRSSSNLIFPDW